MLNIFFDIYKWIKEDYKSHPLRFMIEVIAWACSVGCALAFALTVPNPPFYWLYPFWISGCLLYSWAAWTRKSFGMLLNYLLITGIDTIGLVRLLLN